MKMQDYTYYIGIDPGNHTGVAIWDKKGKKLLSCDTFPIHFAFKAVESHVLNNRDDTFVVFEDARKRKWFGNHGGTAALQGAGSIKRDCTIWEDFLITLGVPFEGIHPIKGATKIDSQLFKAMTKYKGRTSQHARDAAMLVFNR